MAPEIFDVVYGFFFGTSAAVAIRLINGLRSRKHAEIVRLLLVLAVAAIGIVGLALERAIYGPDSETIESALYLGIASLGSAVAVGLTIGSFRKPDR